jgi:hypothetical protein
MGFFLDAFQKEALIVPPITTTALTQNPGCCTSIANSCLGALHFLAAKVAAVGSAIFSCLTSPCVGGAILGAVIVGGICLWVLATCLDGFRLR